VIPVLVAVGYIGLAWLGAKRIAGGSRWETAAWLASLVLAGTSWLFAVQEAAPPPLQLSKVAWVLFYPGPSGYFTAAQHVTDERQYLAEYEQLMAKGDVLHIGTHPPGLIVAYRGLIRLCDALPGLVDLLNATQPDSVRDMLEVLVHNEGIGRNPQPFKRRDAAVLWLAGLLVHGLAAFTVVPLFCLLRRDHSARTAWLAASLWPTVPALAVFLPKSDTILPAFAFGFLALWSTGGLESLRQPATGNRQSAILCVLSGFVLWLGLFISLALLPIVFLATLLTAWDGWLCCREDRIERPARRLLIGFALAGIGFLMPIALLYVTTGMNLFAVWAWNLHNHAGFYSQFPRTYWKWLLVNPVELSIAAGLPLVLLALFASYRPRSDWQRRDCGPMWACLATWLCLWLSGKNMGEVARLWIVIMPCFVWLAARSFGDAGWVEGRDPPALTGRTVVLASSTRPPLLWLVVLTLQFAVGLSIVLNVGGFDVPTPR
jgi:hypothetical protein